ncbi:hypothetical protein BCON_0043g00200 [Botryotinia convoluta]|uniref:Uncharacterized protein n=1 Tax=Botryotinia convoluta TaxID=54673 RepID=A0A4Z1ID55_9HELO|nr:hypothetical protein BCON_0043g00200 [Botryotinia convoluta]
MPSELWEDREDREDVDFYGIREAGNIWQTPNRHEVGQNAISESREEKVKTTDIIQRQTNTLPRARRKQDFSVFKAKEEQ